MELEGLDAVNFVNQHATVRDGSLIGMHITNLNTSPCVELLFEARHTEDFQFAKIELREVKEFHQDFLEDYSNEIAFIKFFRLEAGEFYLSLDPYDENEIVSEKDNDVFRAKQVKLILSHTAPE